MERETFWEVEWYGETPLDENGDSDFDRTPCYVKHFTTKSAALKFAPKAAKKSAIGEAQVQEWWKKPYKYCAEGWEQEYIGEIIYISANEEAA